MRNYCQGFITTAWERVFLNVINRHTPLAMLSKKKSGTISFIITFEGDIYSNLLFLAFDFMLFSVVDLGRFHRFQLIPFQITNYFNFDSSVPE